MLLGTNGCMTYSAVQDAKGHPEKAVWGNPGDNYKQTSAYYFLLPITIPLDLATAPVSFLFLAIGTDGFREF